MKRIRGFSFLLVVVSASSAWAHTVVYPHAHPHPEQSGLADLALGIGIVGLAALAAWKLVRVWGDRRRDGDS